MMRDPLFGIRLKLDRAQQQLHALEADIATFLKSQPYRITPQYNLKSRELTLVARIEKPCSGLWGVQVGEPEALPLPPRPSSRSSNRRRAIETAPGRTFTASRPTEARLIKSLQPFATGEGVRSPLWRLHELSNFKVQFPGSGWPFSASVDKVKVNGPMLFDIAFDEGCPATAGALVIPSLGGVGSGVYETIKRVSKEILGLDL